VSVIIATRGLECRDGGRHSRGRTPGARQAEIIRARLESSEDELSHESVNSCRHGFGGARRFGGGPCIRVTASRPTFCGGCCRPPSEGGAHDLPTLPGERRGERNSAAIAVRRCRGCAAPAAVKTRRTSDSVAIAVSPCRAAPAGAREAFAPVAGAAERRQLTVLFADLVGSTVLGTRLDPEDLREVINAYHGCVTGLSVRYDGFVARYMGDGLLVYFGYPQAREDDAESRGACRARHGRGGAPARHGRRAARHAQCPRQHRDRPRRVRRSHRLRVFAGIAGGRRHAQSRCPPPDHRRTGDVVIADTTRRLTGGCSSTRNSARRHLKGRDAAIEAWAVLGESAIDSRFEALRPARWPWSAAPTRSELMLRRWEQAKAGEGRVFLLSGQPGIGKSRLIAALEQEIRDAPHVRVRFVCSLHIRTAAAPRDPATRARRELPARRFRVREAGKAAPVARRRPLIRARRRAPRDLLSIPAHHRATRPCGLAAAHARDESFPLLLPQLESLARAGPGPRRGGKTFTGPIRPPSILLDP